MPTVATLKAHLESFSDDTPIAYTLWQVGDVQSVAPQLTEEQAAEVLEQAHRRHDASEGINWTVLEAHASYLGT